MNIFRKILILTLALMSAVGMYAVQAWPFPVEVRQPDGTWLTIVQYGDEDFHYCTTLDGVLLVEDRGSWYVGRIDAQGDLVSTGQLAHQEGKRSEEERRLAAAQGSADYVRMGLQAAERRKMRREPISGSTKTLFPHSGTPKAVVILADFPDVPFTIDHPRKAFDEYFNAEGALPDHGFGESANASSVRKYFADVSLGKFNPQFDVFGPVTVDSLKVYGGSRSDGKDENMSQLFQDACEQLDDEIDFSQYDANNDGQVDLVIILYAGYSQSMSGNATRCIWPKSGTTSGGTYDGKMVSRYAVSAELNGYPNCWSAPPHLRINGIGTLCHEFCHTLGLPDFYPTKSSSKADNQGMEYWSIMDSGNYLTNGYTPVALNAWERDCLGWRDIIPLTGDSPLEIRSLDEGGSAYKIANPNDKTGREYYVIENIQNIGHNQWQKGHGLLMYHVDYDATVFSLATNKVNTVVGHPRMTVVPADGWLFAQYNLGKTINGKKIEHADFYAQLAGDPFPGTAGQTEVNDTLGLTSFAPYNGALVNFALEDITETDGVIRLNYYSDFKMRHEQRFPKGDVNHDGTTNVTDAMIVVDIILGKAPIHYCPYHANANKDQATDVSDAMTIVDLILDNK